MKLTCPHCGKTVTMSLAQLASSAKMVVCPQCLGTFEAADVDTSGVPVAQQRVQAPEEPVLRQVRTVSFCHNCGEQLPAKGLRFCPFCGVKLDVSDIGAPAAAAALPDPIFPMQGNAQAPTQAVPSQAQPQPQPQRDTLNSPLFSYTPHYRGSVVREPASARFRAVAFAVIAAQLLLLAVIIYYGLK